jgi:hypothetical protein
MKIFNCIFIVTLMILLMSAGCTSSKESTETVSPNLNDASTVFTEVSLTNAPADYTEGENISSPIVGVWKIQTSDQQVFYWQFHNDGTLTGGSEPGSQEITGSWETFGYGNYFAINAVRPNNNGEQITFNMALTNDLTNGTVSVNYPVEDKNWEFIRQP